MGLNFLQSAVISELENEIKEASQKYYENGSSELSDVEFDEKVEKLRQLSPNSEVLKSVGWGYKSSKDSTPGSRVKHRYGLVGSLDKVRTYSEFSSQMKLVRKFIASLKLDGISVVLYYKDGHMYQALTRGGADNIGIDITDKVRKIFELRNYSLDLVSHIANNDFTGAARGEILMSFEEFEIFQSKHPEAKNPRNSVAGLVNGKEITDDFKHLDLLLYTVIGYESYMNLPSDYDISMDKIIGFLNMHFDNVAPYTTIEDIHDEDSLMENMKNLHNEWYGDYPADGIVLTSDVKFTDTDKGVIEYDAFAFKFPSEKKVTKVQEVEWNVSKTGYVVPRVKFDMLELAGTSVQYATGYNAKYIKDNKIGPGSIVTIEKRGEIIPNIVFVDGSTYASMIDKCPDCGEPLIWEGVHLKCENENCPSKYILDVISWVNNLVPTLGLGDTLIEKFLENMKDAGLIEDISVEALMSIKSLDDSFFKGVKENLFKDTLNRLLFTDTFNLAKAYESLNIQRLGSITSQKLASGGIVLMMNLVDLVNDGNIELRQTTKDEVIKLVGPATFNSILSNRDKFLRLKLIYHRIIDSGLKVLEDSIPVAITGKLSMKRSEFEKILKEKGFLPGNISKDTKFLITDNPNSSSSKNKKADEWGIEKITEEEFTKRYL